MQRTFLLPPRLLAVAAALSLACWVAPAAAQAKLPAAVSKALVKAQVPPSAVSLLVLPVEATGATRLSHRAEAAMNPASVMKLVTTYAALDTLGPQFTWTTSVLLDGEVANGLLTGNLLIQGGGDPKLVVERLQSMLGLVQATGARVVRGDIVLDRSLFQLPPTTAGEFDGEPLRPYNARPDALLINFKSLVMTFTPDAAHGRALVRMEPPLAGVMVDDTVPLAVVARCGDWRSELRASIDNPTRVTFQGSYSQACGERVWPTAYADPASYAARAVEGSWRLLGGLMTGQVRDASPAEAALIRTDGSLSGRKPALRFDVPSLPLLDVVRDVNKFSNNVMAQHLFLTLGLRGARGTAPAGTYEAGQAALQAWWSKTVPGAVAPAMENGSGLSRNERISAASLAALLRHAAQSRLARDFADSLPTAGVDATMRERAKAVAGQASIKTGSLRDVAAIAGYAQGASGARYIVIGIINHPNAGAGRAALDALIQWAVQEG